MNLRLDRAEALRGSFRVMFFLAALVLPFGPSPLGAQAESTLFSAKALSCTFGPGTWAKWKARQPTTHADQWGETIHVVDIDPTKGTAKVMGNRAVAVFQLIRTAMGFHLVERTTTGNMTFLTVYAFMPDGAPDFPAVWSRHMPPILPGNAPSQHYGVCKFLEHE